uniref:Uncharacterized protein n=1 Tax=Oryza sativa subsp. japonica TaxID=39947 RepID=Q5KQA4_ORYSJ|nr:hypothetical protein [Oryza sativa Japonica Group]
MAGAAAAAMGEGRSGVGQAEGGAQPLARSPSAGEVDGGDGWRGEGVAAAAQDKTEAERAPNFDVGWDGLDPSAGKQERGKRWRRSLLSLASSINERRRQERRERDGIAVIVASADAACSSDLIMVNTP